MSGGMGSSTSAITIDVRRGADVTPGNESLVVEVSIKPLIGLVWAGSLVMFLGFGLASMRRLQES